MTYQEFKENLIRVFPAKPFEDIITNNCRCDECDALRHELPGKRWDQISNEFIDFNSSSLCLMEPETLRAFLPAWLLRSMELLPDESVLPEMTLYFLCPDDEEDGFACAVLFNAAQRRVIRDYLVACTAIKYWTPYAKFGLKWSEQDH